MGWCESEVITTVAGGLVFARPDSSSHTCAQPCCGGQHALQSWVDQAGGGWAVTVTDLEGLQPGAPDPVPPETHHDIGERTETGDEGMAADKQL